MQPNAGQIAKSSKVDESFPSNVSPVWWILTSFMTLTETLCHHFTGSEFLNFHLLVIGKLMAPCF